MVVGSLTHFDDSPLLVVANSKATNSSCNMSNNNSASNSIPSSSHHCPVVANSICRGIYSHTISPPLRGVISVGRSLGSGKWDEDKKELLLRSRSTSSVANCCSTTTNTSSTVESEMEVYDFATLLGWSEQEIAAVADYWDFSDEYRNALYELGYRLRDINHCRNCAEEVAFFLITTFGKVDKAENMFRDCIRWREKVGADTIMQHPPPQEVIDNIPGAILKGADREGDPIFLDRFLSCDILGLLNKYGADTLVRHAVWVREAGAQGAWLKDWEKREGKKVRQVTVIYDVEGLSRKFIMHKKAIDAYGEIMRLDQDYYPESFKRIIMIRTPVFFRLVFALIRPFLNHDYVAKMIFCGKENYREVLSRYVDLKVLPSVVVEEGEGEAVDGLPNNWEGGPLSAIH